MRVSNIEQQEHQEILATAEAEEKMEAG